jgi:hypothetical protein
MASNWKIPTWELAQWNVNNHVDDALDRFVCDNEPSKPHDKLFRAQLQELVDFIVGELE